MPIREPSGDSQRAARSQSGRVREARALKRQSAEQWVVFDSLDGRAGRFAAGVRAVAATTSEQDVTFLAAAVAYYGFVSLLPAAVLALVVATAVGGEQLAQVVVAASGDLLTPAGQELLVNALRGGAGRSGATAFSLALAVWGALKVFRGVDTAFANIYGVVESPGLVDQLKDSAVVAVSVVASVAVMVGIGSVVAALQLGVLLEVASILVLPAVLTAAFLPMYYFFPEPRVGLREVLPGALFAGVGWTVLQAAFQAYLEFQAAGSGTKADVYGVIGGVLLFVTWLYLAGIVVLVGVVVNVVLTPHRSPGPDDGAGGIGAQGAGGDASAVSDGGDRHGKGGDARAGERMTDAEDDRDEPAPDIADLERRVAELRAELDDLDGRTVEKPALEDELKRYVRGRMRRGHARGWGPYLVLLYGVVLTLGAFVYEDGWFAIGAMVVLFLSTLGLYVLFVLVGLGLNLLDVPGKALDAVRGRR